MSRLSALLTPWPSSQWLILTSLESAHIFRDPAYSFHCIPVAVGFMSLYEGRMFRSARIRRYKRPSVGSEVGGSHLARHTHSKVRLLYCMLKIFNKTRIIRRSEATTKNIHIRVRKKARLNLSSVLVILIHNSISHIKRSECKVTQVTYRASQPATVRTFWCLVHQSWQTSSCRSSHRTVT